MSRLSRVRAAAAKATANANDPSLWPVIVALVVAIPAFYLELVPTGHRALGAALYLLAASLVGLALWQGRRSAARRGRRYAGWPDAVLVAGLLASAVLPPSGESLPALGVRLVFAVALLARLTLMLRHLVREGSLPYMLALALAVLGLCGLGFWWLEPDAETLADGLWLAFTTAATVGYGDIVPTTLASKVFSVFVVLLGYGVLSLVTASIAAMWIESEERRIEREILRDLHGELKELRSEVKALRAAIESAPPRSPGPPSPPA